VAAKVNLERSKTEHATSGNRTDHRIKTTTDARTAKSTTYNAVGDFEAETIKKLTKTIVLRGHSCGQII